MLDSVFLIGLHCIYAGGDGVDLLLKLREALLILLAVFLHQFFIILLHLLVMKVIILYFLQEFLEALALAHLLRLVTDELLRFRGLE